MLRNAYFAGTAIMSLPSTSPTKTLLVPELLPLADFVSVLNVSFFTIGMLLLLGLPSGPFVSRFFVCPRR